MSFRNPYVFIPIVPSTAELTEEINIARKGDDQDERPVTGVIRCRLTTKKKVIVPAAAGDSEVRLPLFRLSYGEGGKEFPAIPGSSLRGVMRGVYETLTRSCMRYNKAHGKRLASAGGLKFPGLLYRDSSGNYVLGKAVRHKIWSEDVAESLSTGNVVEFTSKSAKDSGGNLKDNVPVVYEIEQCNYKGALADIANGNNTRLGVFLRVDKLAGEGSEAPQKKDNNRNGPHPSVFSGESVLDSNVSQEFIDALEDNVERYRENGHEPGEAYSKCLDAMIKKKAVLPVWYARQFIGGKWHYQFSWAQISRVVYAKTVNDFYSDQKISACPSKKSPRSGSPCPACSLFGFVSQEKGVDSVRASRVRFGDAKLCDEERSSWEDDDSDVWPWLPELMEPRTSSFEFYLRRPDSEHLFTPEMPGTEIAGRKFYWHHDAEEQTADGEKRTKQNDEVLNRRVECLPTGKHFQFSVYVDGVTRHQLNDLVYVLTLGEYWDEDSKQGKHCHKIGKGKPYGYGSVSIEVTSIVERTVSEDGYVLKPVEKGDNLVMSLDEVKKDFVNVKALRNVTLLGAGGKSVQYPRASGKGGDKEKTIFKWFFKNRELFDEKTQGLPGYKSVLLPVPGTKEMSAEELSAVDLLRPEPLSGTISEARYSPSSGHWNGRIVYGERNRSIFFHTSESPQIDLETATPEKGKRVTFTIGRNPKNGQSMACNLQIM